MSKKSGLTMTMLIIYIIVLSIIVGAITINLGNNDQIEGLHKAAYQAKAQDYIEQFTSMKNFYSLKNEFDDEITIRNDERDIYGRSIMDYIGAITIEDKDYFCIYNGNLHFYNIDTDDVRYDYLVELGLTPVE